MNAVLKLFLSMSFSGGFLILILLLGMRFLKDKISRQWQYYIWLVVVVRLLFPFAPEVSLLGKAYQSVDQAISGAAQEPFSPDISESGYDLSVGSDTDFDRSNENAKEPAEDSQKVRPLQEIGELLTAHIWLVWLLAALALLIRKVTIYQSFVRFIRAGWSPVCDMKMLDRFFAAAETAGVKRPIELYVNPLVSSPLMIGFFHPYIVLPSADISEKDFYYIALHELTHYRRRDMFYKWLVQVTVCLHWFNPLVYFMSKETVRACEFSCDEAVLTKIGGDNAENYGKTLLDAMAAVGKYRETIGSVTLGENKKILKERLGAIMNFKRKSKAVRILTCSLTLCVMLGAFFVGVYPVSAASAQMAGSSSAAEKGISAAAKTARKSGTYTRLAEKYYKAGSLPLFQIVFFKLDEKEQSKWLNRIYEDQDIAFMLAVVTMLDDDCDLILNLAETVYKDDDVTFFSSLAAHMSEETLEDWLERALKDEKWAIQSVLFNTLDLDDEFDELEEKKEKEWVAEQKAQYAAVGVTYDGKKNYYYKGKLVHIFLDIRPDKSFYTLEVNPKGTVDIKIVRNKKNEITGVVYLNEEEIRELFGDEDDSDDTFDEKIIPVDLKSVAAGETILLGEYTLSDGDEILYDISVKKGNRVMVFFAKDEQEDVVYWSVNNLRQPGEPLECIADFIVGHPAKPGTYKLYLRAPDGALENVRGSVSIVPADAFEK